MDDFTNTFLLDFACAVLELGDEIPLDLEVRLMSQGFDLDALRKEVMSNG